MVLARFISMVYKKIYIQPFSSQQFHKAMLQLSELFLRECCFTVLLLWGRRIQGPRTLDANLTGKMACCPWKCPELMSRHCQRFSPQDEGSQGPFTIEVEDQFFFSYLVLILCSRPLQINLLRYFGIHVKNVVSLLCNLRPTPSQPVVLFSLQEILG